MMAAAMAAAARMLLLSRIGSVVSGFSLLNSFRWSSSVSRRGLRLAASLLSDPFKVRMPSLSPTMTEGTIVKWYKKEGESVVPGDVLCDIQTDKAVLGLEIEEEGILAKIMKPDNTANIKVGSLIGLIVETGSDWQSVPIPVEEESSTPASAPSPSQAPPSTAAPSATGTKTGASYGPAVRALISVYKIDPGEVSATGPHGRLVKGDMLKFIEDRHLKPAAAPVEPLPVAAPSPPPPAVSAVPKPAAATKLPRAPAVVDSTGYTDIELTTMRSVIAKRLTLSKTTIPHQYGSIDSNIGRLLEFRKELVADGVKVGVNDFIIKATAVALQKVPLVNSVWNGDSARLLSNIDISVAVATDNGLITPIVKDAISLGVEGISLCVKDLASRARAGKLKPEEFQGGTFTISNLGMYGISSFSAVINPPQACILAVGGARTVLDSDCQPQTLLSVTLSSDARIVDDALSAEFLECFREVMENPELMLSHGRPVDLQKLFAK